MKQLLLFVFAFFTLSLQAQLVLDDSAVSGTFDLSEPNSDDFDVHTFVTNNGNSGTYVWERSVVSINNCWGTAVCIDDLCYSPGQDSFTFEFDSGTQAELILHAYTGGLPFAGMEERATGEAVVELTVYEEADPTNTVTVTYTMTVGGPAEQACNIINTDDIAEEAKNINIFPNPASHYFTISANEIVDEIEVYNIIGRKVKTFTANDDDRYDVLDLPNGMYLVSFINNEHGVVKTKRLSKRTVHP